MKNANDLALESLKASEATLAKSIAERKQHPDANTPNRLKVTQKEEKDLLEIQDEIKRLSPPAQTKGK